MTTTLDETRLEAFIGQLVGELGATLNAALVRIGDKLGLYRAMADAGPMSSTELAAHTGTAERYVREWLAAQAAGGFLIYHPDIERYELPAQHAMVLAHERSPFFMLGGFELASACLADEPRVAEAFRSGEGIGWDDHDHRLYEGTERFFAPGYRGNLLDTWIPALDGVQAKLEAGARVADVGCGRGASTLLMAEAFPRSIIRGFDYHAESIGAARRAAELAQVELRALFEVAGAHDFEGDDYDLICFFDCLHDLGDPVGALRHVREALADDGTVMLVEPRAGDQVEENLHPIGRVAYCASTLLCTPNSLSQDVGLALGAQAGEARLAAIARDAGLTQMRRVAETPLNIVLEVRG